MTVEKDLYRSQSDVAFLNNHRIFVKTNQDIAMKEGLAEFCISINPKSRAKHIVGNVLNQSFKSVGWLNP
jgi:hypothetical protein